VFDDFRARRDREARRRFGASLGAASFAFTALAAVAIATTASGSTPAATPVEEVFVELAPPEPEPEPPPEIEPPPPSPQPSPSPRPRVVRPDLAPPDEIPDETLEQSDADLVDEGDGGGRTGFTDGGGRGRGEGPRREEPQPEPPRPPRPSGPIQLPETGTPAQRLGDPPELDYPETARRAGIQGAVLVRCAIDLEGVPGQCRVLRGAEELRDAALAWALDNRFSPARLEDGTPVVTWKVLPVIFRLTNI
jgi:protein TonB